MTSIIERHPEQEQAGNQQGEAVADHSEVPIESPGALIERMAEIHGSEPDRERIPYQQIEAISNAFDSLIPEGEADEYGVFDRYIDPVTNEEVNFLTATDLQAELDNDREYWHLPRRLPNPEIAEAEPTAPAEAEPETPSENAQEQEPAASVPAPEAGRKNKRPATEEEKAERARLVSIHEAAKQAGDESRIKPPKMGWKTYGQMLAYNEAKQQSAAEQPTSDPVVTPESEPDTSDTPNEGTPDENPAEEQPVTADTLETTDEADTDKPAAARTPIVIELADGTMARPSPVVRNPTPAEPTPEPDTTPEVTENDGAITPDDGETPVVPPAPRRRRNRPRGTQGGIGIERIRQLRAAENGQLAAGEAGVVRHTDDEGQKETWREYEARLPRRVSVAKRLGALASAAIVGGKSFLLEDEPKVVALDRARSHYDQKMEEKRLEANAAGAAAGSIVSQRFAQAKEKFDDLSRSAYAALSTPSDSLANASNKLNGYLETDPNKSRKIAGIAVGALAIAGLGLALVQARYGIEDGGLMAAGPRPGTEDFIGPVALTPEAPITPDVAVDPPQTEIDQTEHQVVALDAYNSETAAGTVEGEVKEQLDNLGADSSQKSVNIIRDATLDLNDWSHADARELGVGQEVRLLSPQEIAELLRANDKS